MTSSRPPGARKPGWLQGLLCILICAATPVLAGDDDDTDQADQAADMPVAASPAKLGMVQTRLQRADKQATLFGKLSDQYGAFKERMEEEHGLSWSFSLSYRQRWVDPDTIGSSAQTLFWPSLNWEMFDSERFGAGSFQLLYYGERRSDSKITLKRRGYTLSGEIPDSASKFSQITYTHTLPGEKLAIAVGQFSFFNFDSNDYLADQQLNFVNTIFSSNGSSTYAVTGVGGYVQFNATPTLQFLVGTQRVNAEDSTKRPGEFIGNSPYSWLAYVQWKPAFRHLGTAQYSLGLYEAPPIDGRLASRGWSINAMQNLSDRWAVFGRLNASTDDGANSKSSQAVGVALNNPLGRMAGDQIGIAYGTLAQTIALFNRTLSHRQNTLEAYWNISLQEGLLLTPDIQIIRNPAFAPLRDTATIFSLRTTLVF